MCSYLVTKPAPVPAEKTAAAAARDPAAALPAAKPETSPGA